jgi:hypothetical protein
MWGLLSGGLAAVWDAVRADSRERPDRFDPLNRPPAAGEYRAQ